MNIALFSALAAVCVLLAVHPRYPDGLFGRGALATIVTLCVIGIIGEIKDASAFDVDAGPFFILIAVTVFLYRHAYRFLLWAHFGKHAWTASRELQRPPPSVEAK